MKNMKFWRTALVAALVLTVMLSVTGGTIAWFTDSVESNNNKIQAGNLDVQLLMNTGNDYEDISDSDAPIFGTGSIACENNAETLWEPGKTQVAYLQVRNNGNLALKYQVSLVVKNVAKDLYKAMEYAIVPDADTLSKPVIAWTSGSTVTEGVQIVSDNYVSLGVGETHNFALAIHMKESAGNEYQNGQVDFDLMIQATQDTVEEDSFNERYDEKATNPAPVVVNSSKELTALFAQESDGKTIYLKAGTYNDLSFTNPANYKAKNLTLVGEEGTILNGLSFNNWAENVNIVIDGLTLKNITFAQGVGLNTVSMSNVVVEDCDFIDNARIIQGDAKEKLTNLEVKNCNFTGTINAGDDENVTAIMLENVTDVKISGCTFTNIDYNAIQAGTLNGTVLIDSNTINGTGSRVFRFVTVNGDVTISNNIITSDGENGELAKVTNECEMTLSGNTWNGLSDTEVAYKLINITAK